MYIQLIDSENSINSSNVNNLVKNQSLSASMNSHQIAFDILTVNNPWFHLQMNGPFIESLRPDGEGGSNFETEWIHSKTGYMWYLAASSEAIPIENQGFWQLIDNNTFDYSYNFGKYIETKLRLSILNNKITFNYDFEILKEQSFKKNGWVWSLAQTTAGYTPELIDCIYGYIGDTEGQFMTMHQVKRRENVNIFGNHHRYWFQGTNVAGASMEFNVPAEEAEFTFLNWDKHLGIVTWSFPREEGNDNRIIAQNIKFSRTYSFSIQPIGDWLTNAPKSYPIVDIQTDQKIGEHFLDYGHAFTRFWWERSFSWGPQPGGDWLDWDAINFASISPTFYERTKNTLENVVIDGEGFVYTWGSQPGWPFPDPSIYDTRKPTSNPNYLLAMYRLWQWNADNTWAISQQNRIRNATKFLENMLLEPWEVNNLSRVSFQEGAIPLPVDALGLQFCDWIGHHGASGGIGSNYWDILPFGWLSAFSNSLAYPALLSAAEFEESWNNTIRANELRSKAELLREAYNKLFWDDLRGRYVGCIDAFGVTHDYGFTMVNTQAITNGLANTSQVYRIFNWMENEPTASGEKDTFTKWIYTARTTTEVNSRHALNRTIDQDWWVAEGQVGMNYGKPGHGPWWTIQDGGGSIYMTYYELMSRVKYLGSDNTENRIKTILDRWSLPDHICGGTPLYLGEIPQQEHGGSVGTDFPFPESGIWGNALIYGLMGINPDQNCLVLNPSLPSSWSQYSIRNLYFAQMLINVTINATMVTIDFPMLISNELSIEINNSREIIRDLQDPNGKVRIPYASRIQEIQELQEQANLEYTKLLANNHTLNASGMNALISPPIPSYKTDPSLGDKDYSKKLWDWWVSAGNLLSSQEFNTLTNSISVAETKSDINKPWSMLGRYEYNMVLLQRTEAEAARQRGDLRWCLVNYMQATIIAERVQLAEQDRSTSIIMQWILIPIAFMGLAILTLSKWRQMRNE